ncbi:MAG: LicD family protein [Treponemataceae bacterium]
MNEKKYDLGYLSIILTDFNFSLFEKIKDIALQCRKFIVGIPADYVMARIYGDERNGYTAEKTKLFLDELKFIDQVIILDYINFGYQDLWKQLNFDVCFYGSCYGIQFEKDKKFFASNGVDFLPLLPLTCNPSNNIDSLDLALKNVQKNQKIILFGTGKYFDIFVEKYVEHYKVSYAVDNTPKKWNTTKNGIKIKSVDSLKSERVQDCLVILCGKDYENMLLQLKSLGNFNYRTMIFNDKISLIEEMYVTLQAEIAYLDFAHKKLKDLLFEFDRVCKKYNLKYFLICGSLIGAIRHKGFISWDDDMDLTMTRSDYEILKQVAPKEWKDSDYELLHYDCLGKNVFLDFMPRLIYLKDDFPTKVFDKAGKKIFPKYDRKVFIDIYPLDNASDNDRKHNFTMLKMKFVYNLCMGHRGILDYSEYSRLPKWQVNTIKFVNFLGKLLPFKFLIKRYEKLAQYAKKEKCKNYFMSSCSIMCIERKFDKKIFQQEKNVPFEDIECVIPEDYDALLNAMGYKNYMSLPPLSIRKPSHYFNCDISIW